MAKLESDSLTGVSETLFVPLHYRATASRDASNPFKDPTAERFHDQIVYDWDKLGTGVLSPLQKAGMAARTTILDEQVQTFVAREPNALVVNLGAGLDTRFYRIDNGTIAWVEIDLPPVIALRRRLEESIGARHILLSGSVLDDEWIADVKRYARERVLFVAEGLFPYFSETEHREIFSRLVDNFPGQDMLFLTSAPSVTQGLAPHSDLPKMRSNVELGWGLEESADVSALAEGVEYVREFPLLANAEELLAKLPDELQAKLSPEVLRKAAKIVHVRFR
jgi:O-methyltransferase involved in polyketide biosynthesis